MTRPAPLGELPIGSEATWTSPLDTDELAAHVTECRTTPDATKGAALEHLMTWLLPAIPGFSVEHVHQWAIGGASEVDLTVWNRQHQDGFPSFPDVILVECK